MQLRDYQRTAIEGVRDAFRQGKRRVLLVAPTGAGKTVMFSHLARAISICGQRVVLMAHRDELLDQIGRTLTQVGVEHGFIAARRPMNLETLVQVAGVHTFKNKAGKLPWAPHWIICDEAHHATAGSWAKIIAAYPDARVLGVTATPERLDGKGLGNVFQAMVRGPEVADLIGRGFLSPVKYYCPRTVDTDGLKLRMGDYKHADVDARVNNSRVTGEAVDWYRKLCNGAPAVAFCASIKHSEHVAETFRAAGYRWASLDSTMTPWARREAVESLGNGRLHGISSCDIISEGFDLPIVSAAILLRPTASLGLYLQQVGRVLRIAPGKTHATIIDHVGNCGSTRAGEWVEKHGFAEDVREWALDGRRKRKGTAPVRLCAECFAVCSAGSSVCPQCGAEKPVVEREIEQAAAGDLEEVEREAIKQKTEKLIKKAKTLEDWQRIAKLRGYAPGWAYHRHNQRTAKRTTYKIK
jgi:superfamily II DNA or RNA helicase